MQGVGCFIYIGLQEEVEELGVRGWRGDCHSLPEIVGCAVFDVLY